MVNAVKKSIFTVLIVLLTLLATSCDLLGGSLTEYINEYTHNAAIEEYSFSMDFPRTASGTTCISPEGSIVLYLRNPMKYSCTFEYEFRNASVQSYFNSNYASQGHNIQFTSMDEDNSIYEMTFPEGFIEAIDECAVTNGSTPIKDISGTVTVFEAETHRQFDFGTFDLTMHADTVPQSVGSALLQLDKPTTESDATYVVCFDISWSNLNNDFDTIKINNDTWKVSYDSQISSLTPVGTPHGTLELNPDIEPDLFPLEEGGVTFSTHANRDTLYYYSHDVRTDSETIYKIVITDKAGLTATALVSSSIEKLTPIVISFNPEEGELITANDDGFFNVTITHDGLTQKNEQVATSPVITCLITDIYGHTEESSGVSPLTVQLPIGKGYSLSANASSPGYLSDTDVTTNSFDVIHSPQFYVSASGSDTDEGTKSAPFRTFKKCVDYIIEYKESYSEPDGGVFINVLSDITPDETDFSSYQTSLGQVQQDRLFSNYSLALEKQLDGKVTIRGLDETGTSQQRTINAQGSSKNNNRGVMFWGGNSTLSVKNITFKGGYMTDQNGAGVSLYASAVATDQLHPETLKATFTDCVFTDNTVVSTNNDYPCGGGGLAVCSGYNNSSRFSLVDCTISGNTASGFAMGGGIYDYTPSPDTISGTLELKGSTQIIENKSESNAGGIYCDSAITLYANTVHIKDNVCGEREEYTMSIGYGAGFYADVHSTVNLRGAIITGNKTANNMPSNLFLAGYEEDARVIQVYGDLTGSQIGISSAVQPASEDDPAAVFAEYTAIYMPAEGIFISDDDIPIKIGISEAKFSIAGMRPATGNLIVPEEAYDDICIFINTVSIPDSENPFDPFKFMFIDSGGHVLNGVEITSLTVFTAYEEIESSESTWLFEDNILTFAEEFGIKSSTSGSTFVICIFFEYNGHLYSCNFIPLG